MIDRDGITGCTMRAVAEHLSVAPMTIYRHVADKEELLAGIPDALVAPVAAEVLRRRRGITALRAVADGLAAVLQAHPGTAQLFDHPQRGPNITAAAEHCVALLTGEGLDAPEAFDCVRAVVAQVIGEAITRDGSREHRGLGWLLDGIAARLTRAR